MLWSDIIEVWNSVGDYILHFFDVFNQPLVETLDQLDIGNMNLMSPIVSLVQSWETDSIILQSIIDFIVENFSGNSSWLEDIILEFATNVIGDYTLFQFMMVCLGTFLIPFTVIKWLLDIVL